ncbi:MAG: TatD family hydrolase [Nitrosomonadales bacterium]|nr:TatD family hydrolase [Nitrosomonadales bacterium]
MFIDSHCHLNFPGLSEQLDALLENMRVNQVSHALCVSVDLLSFPEVLAIAENHANLYASVGVHPDYELDTEPTQSGIVALAQHPKVVAIGETGLDYYRLTGDLEWQRERFRTHIRAAKESGKPLIIHTRSAAADTLRIMAEEQAGQVGGVMHCFTENLEVAQAAIEQGFHISFSGILTFKNATIIKEAAQNIPLDRILIETDSPYLAPTPHRGKTNQPAFVKHVAEEIARLRNIPLEEVGAATTRNFNRLFLKQA